MADHGLVPLHVGELRVELGFHDLELLLDVPQLVLYGEDLALGMDFSAAAIMLYIDSWRAL